MAKIKSKFDSTIAAFLVISLVSNIVLGFVINNMINQNSIILQGNRVNTNGGTTVTPGTVATSPDTKPVNIAVVNDKRCTNCDVSPIIQSLQQLFPTASIKILDYSEAAASSLIAETKTVLLPAVFFDNTVKDSAGYSGVQNYLESKGTYYSLKIGAVWDPFCDANKDNCADIRCAGRTACRDSIPNKLDLFVMSRCPYGTQAETALKEFISSVKGVVYDINFIASYDAATDKFSSLHGDAEVVDNLRQVCVKQYYPSNLLDFILCRNKDFNADVSVCLTGMNATIVNGCASGQEGKELLKKSIAITNGLNVQASPTFLVNNVKLFNAVTANDIKTSYCKLNAVEGCDKQLTNSSAVAGNCATPAT